MNALRKYHAHDIVELRQRLLHEWRGVQQSLTDEAVQLTNGQHACVLVFLTMVGILNIPCDCQFVFFCT